MRAACVREYGAQPALANVADPNIGPEEVLVRVQAASLNPLDVKRQGGALRDVIPLRFPYVLGTDLAGTVERAGRLATRWHSGDRVVARLDPARGGALADFAVVPAADLASAPPRVPLDDAAGVPTAAGTAWQALLEVADLKRGQTVLVHSGTGGVGSFAIQMARITGARVIATASGAGVELCRRLGADRVIDHGSACFAHELSDIDVVLDTIGGRTQQQSFDVLRSGGTLISTTSAPNEALARAHKITAAFLFHRSDANRLGLILGLLNSGLLKVLVDRKAPLEHVDVAFLHLQSGYAHGKIIIGIRQGQQGLHPSRSEGIRPS